MTLGNLFNDITELHLDLIRCKVFTANAGALICAPARDAYR